MISTVGRTQQGKGMYLHLQAQPLSGRVNISYRLVKDSGVELSVYDQNGQKVNTLLKDFKESGKHLLEWDSSQLQAGMYFVYFRGAGRQFVKRMRI